MSLSSLDNGEPVTGRAWAVLIVVLVVVGTVAYLGWASSYLSARLFFGASKTPAPSISIPNSP